MVDTVKYYYTMFIKFNNERTENKNQTIFLSLICQIFLCVNYLKDTNGFMLNYYATKYHCHLLKKKQLQKKS